MVDDEPGGGCEQHSQLDHGGGGGDDEHFLKLGLGGAEHNKQSQLEHWVGGDATHHPELGHVQMDGLVVEEGGHLAQLDAVCATASTRVVPSTAVCTAASVSLTAFTAVSSDEAALAATSARS